MNRVEELLKRNAELLAERERLRGLLRDLKEMADLQVYFKREDLARGIRNANRGVSPFSGEHGRG